ncbi:sn-glycerol-3-phosphate ABC transporter ATP-binding protein UgpC [Albimonas sp. CAU 1670]|uniref:ABC transporter ATP-binding protein n=1 Tax=Albimonas sp. CAU 1670 TaxID=3032599 RepID=UPI0023DA99CA|nr:sn-glycerol-3-phosphate ABC transporter ATP-binding protein UgpC [Albimonas sp. CAU 1670]MDF2235094.1 sn-glycerol-3-phosphate ABC transporter ATP-binding protein UgpC [Albimonas sp. CAU 1670]
MSHVVFTGLRKRYGDAAALHGIDLAIEAGEFVVVVGPSGCGKSTLLRMIAGLEDVTEGEIAVAGEVVNDLDPADRGCAMVFQNYALYPHMTVAENIGYPLRLARVPKAERTARVQAAAAILGLEPYLDRRPRALSGGQRQRVAMGRAIVREPRLFLFDEPLSNLDATLRVQMRIELRRLHRRLGATSILVTHDQVEAMTMADRLVVMNAGRIEQQGAPSEVYARPASTFVAGFLGAPAMNLMPAILDEGGRIVPDAAPGLALPARLPLRAGASLTLGVRPEDLRLAAPDQPGLPGRVDLVEDLGGARIAHCLVDGGHVSAALDRAAPWREGDPVSLAPDPARLHAFALDTGLRLAEADAFPVGAMTPAGPVGQQAMAR